MFWDNGESSSEARILLIVGSYTKSWEHILLTVGSYQKSPQQQIQKKRHDHELGPSRRFGPPSEVCLYVGKVWATEAAQNKPKVVNL